MEEVDHIFARMLVKYQQKWSSMLTDDVIIEATTLEWASQIEGLTKKHIQYGLDACLDFYPEWPPNPGQFRSLCKSADIEPEYEAPKLDNPTKPETLKAALKQMRESLK